jgi:hypothetical protein
MYIYNILIVYKGKNETREKALFSPPEGRGREDQRLRHGSGSACPAREEDGIG